MREQEQGGLPGKLRDLPSPRAWECRLREAGSSVPWEGSGPGLIPNSPPHTLYSHKPSQTPCYMVNQPLCPPILLTLLYQVLPVLPQLLSIAPPMLGHLKLSFPPNI